MYFGCFSFSFKTESWKKSTDCCEWDGVTCDTISGHVIELDLSCNNLNGELHPNSTIFQLRHLQQLNLAFNDIFGSSMPLGIGDLVKLMHLNISNCYLSGNIPSTISHLSKLVSLDLSINWFLEINPFTWNKLIHNATNLRDLYLNGVNMSSIRESSLSMLKNLSSSLVSLSLANTGLQGNLSSDILSLPNLQKLDLVGNDGLSGQLPKSNWSTPLRYLYLHYSAFSGEIPYSIGQLKSLTHLVLSDCNLDGMVPLSLWNLTQLTHLDLSQNNLSWSIPDVCGNLIKLEYLYLFSNNLAGQVPSSLFNLPQLSFLCLSSNKLVGPIAIEITKRSKLSYVDLSYNMLNGTIPHWCYSLPSLLELSLSDNHLTGFIGMIPQCLGTFPLLSILDMQMNNLYGIIPRTFSKGNAFETIKLNGNQLKGPLPQSLAHCSNLEVLDLGDNSIEDTFPNWLETLQELQVLSLRSNHLHGAITCSSIKHSFPKLRIFDVSNNNFSGTLPTSCIKNFQGMMNVNDSQIGLQYMGKASYYNYYNDSVVVVMKGLSMDLTRILCYILEVVDKIRNL
ncbi:receptor-like protein 9DC3 [Medicago truncatula]|nr:receptor-like protein 9DC3 [Medicago truncatula]